MALINKSSDINKIWAASGDVLAPSDAKISGDWLVEIPPRQYFNYIDNKQDQSIAHFNQMGIAVWDAVTEYQYNSAGVKSLCQGSDGIIYRTVQTSVNQNPVTDNTDAYWTPAFSSAGDVYSKTASDARYAQLANNGSDFPNQATLRTNLNLYSKTEVDAKTTVATSTQAQAFTSPTALISALALAQAFQGTNQAKTSSGYQKLPGGMIVQWGSYLTSGGTFAVTFPTPFPTIIVGVLVVDSGATGWSPTNVTTNGVASPTLTGFTARSFSWNGSAFSAAAAACNYVAIGY